MKKLWPNIVRSWIALKIFQDLPEDYSISVHLQSCPQIRKYVEFVFIAGIDKNIKGTRKTYGVPNLAYVCGYECVSLMYNTCLADKTTTTITTNSICCKSSTLTLRSVGGEGIQIVGNNAKKGFITIHQTAFFLPLASSITHEIFSCIYGRHKEKNEIKE